uniref:SPRY domain-containing SOCS box protein 1-like n=1 Tax=Gouania willdenowi TaxID=441366 RepID=A0A8C5I3H6_GOUWI
MGLLMSVWHPSAPTTSSHPTFSSDFHRMAFPISSRLAVTLNSPPVSPADSRSRWSSDQHSHHFLLSPCKREATRSPAELSSDGVRAEMGVTSGLHVWEVVWNPSHRGSHAVLGISMHDCPLQASGYNVLVGGDSQSWGWELKTNQLWHDGQTLQLYPRNGHPEVAQSPLLIPEHILMVLDADAGTLGFVVDGCFLGVAFRHLPHGVELFPAVSSVRGGARIKLRYLNGDPPALLALCGLSIHQCLGQPRHNQMDKLPLPPVLQQYLRRSHYYTHY